MKCQFGRGRGRKEEEERDEEEDLKPDTNTEMQIGD